VLAVGYRVNSVQQATDFRKWATTTLHEFIIKGFVLGDECLKQGRNFFQDYFDELLERIREIRAFEPMDVGQIKWYMGFARLIPLKIVNDPIFNPGGWYHSFSCCLHIIHT
jgi:hypothetical protein